VLLDSPTFLSFLYEPETETEPHQLVVVRQSDPAADDIILINRGVSQVMSPCQ